MKKQQDKEIELEQKLTEEESHAVRGILNRTVLSWNEVTGMDWVRLIKATGEFTDRCDWGKLDGGDWSGLLQEQPQFADRCDWGKLDGRGWCALLQKQPQFADKCDWSKFGPSQWVNVLDKHPELVKYRPGYGKDVMEQRATVHGKDAQWDKYFAIVFYNPVTMECHASGYSLGSEFAEHAESLEDAVCRFKGWVWSESS